jgi:Ni/Co efflux regulator RcnB
MRMLASALVATVCFTAPVLAGSPAANQVQLAQAEIRIGDRDRDRDHDREWRRHREHARVCKTVVIHEHGEVRKIRRCRGD